MTTKLLKAIRQRAKAGKSKAGRGIGLASQYVETINQVTPNGLSRAFKDVSPQKAALEIRQARSTLVFRNPDCQVYGGIKKGKTSGTVLSFGKPTRKDADKLTPKSILDFECVLTSNRKDR